MGIAVRTGKSIKSTKNSAVYRPVSHYMRESHVFQEQPQIDTQFSENLSHKFSRFELFFLTLFSVSAISFRQFLRIENLTPVSQPHQLDGVYEIIC